MSDSERLLLVLYDVLLPRQKGHGTVIFSANPMPRLGQRSSASIAKREFAFPLKYGA